MRTEMNDVATLTLLLSTLFNSVVLGYFFLYFLYWDRSKDGEDENFFN